MQNSDDDLRPNLTTFVTFRLARTQNKLNAQATYFLKSNSDLSLVEWRIIQLMRIFSGASMSQLAAEVQMDKGQLSRKVTVMVNKGLIEATPDKLDQRKQNLALTQKALAISEDMLPIMRKRQAKLVSRVSSKELDVFFKVLEAIDAAAEFRDES